MKRTLEQIQSIKETFSSPFSVDNFLNTEEIDYLEKIFDQADNTNNFYQGKIYKNTGPITLDLKYYSEDIIISKILKKLKDHIGNFEITAAFFFKTNYPHIIHNDDTHELPSNVYKGITLPLKIYPQEIKKFPKLCFFDQCYFHGPSKFFYGDKNIPTYYNKQLYDYTEVENLSLDKIDDQLVKDYFSHMKPSWLTGLSLNSIVSWIPGNAIIFDSVRLHCASDFRKLGINSKLGISIFTKKC